MKAAFEVEGMRELDDNLAALPNATAKAVVRRGLTRLLQPVADMANGLWPGADDSAFAVSSKLKRGQVPPEKGPYIVNVFVGSTPAAPHAHLLEWGTAPRYHKSGKYVGAVAPVPSLTPSWDANRDQMLQNLAAIVWEDLKATQARRAKRGL
ncbi:MAG: hypothetical protein AB3N24_07325 [Leisingera sp.]